MEHTKTFMENLTTVARTPAPQSITESMAAAKRNEEWMNRLALNTNQAGGVICQSARQYGIPRWAKEKLESAHSYLYAAMMADFVVMAETQIICDGIRMDSGELKSSRQYLIDDFIGEMFSEVSQMHRGESDPFTDGIRRRMEIILAIDAAK